MSFDAAILDHHMEPLRPFLDAAYVSELVIIEDCPKNIAAIRRACSDLVPKIYAINVAKFTCNQ